MSDQKDLKDNKDLKDDKSSLAVLEVLAVPGRVGLPYTRTLPGPAAFTPSLTPDSYFLKFSANMSASWVALAS